MTKEEIFDILYKFFYHIHFFFEMCRDQTFQFIQNNTFGRLYPVGKFNVRLIGLCEFQQTLQIEIVIYPAPFCMASYALHSCSICAGTIKIGFLKYIASQIDSNPAVLAYALHPAICRKKSVSSS